MKIRRLWLAVAVLLCAVVTGAAMMPSTLAYMATRSNSVSNDFRVVYLPPEDITVPVQVTKTVQCIGEDTIGPEGFFFRLENLTTGEELTMTAGADGLASRELAFTADDVDKTYQYRLREINGGREYVTYDESVYEINITLVLVEHEMVAQITVNGETVTEIAAEFENLYSPVQIPDTGDHDEPLMWLALLMISGAALRRLLSGTKSRRILWTRKL